MSIETISRWFVVGERSGKALAAVKLINSALVLAWGFGTTYVFAAALGIEEFANFVLLVALANFTIGAEFGVTNIVYSRLRRHIVASDSDFAYAEIGVLIAVLVAIVVIASAAISVAIASGIIATALPALFVGVFLVGAMNILVLFAKRVLAGLDRNLWYEAIDIVRRAICLALLFAVLAGFDLTISVYAQLIVTLIALVLCFAAAIAVSGVDYRAWAALSEGMAHIRKGYREAIGPAVILTAVDIAGYNLPFVMVAALTDDVRPLLLYDLMYKLIRTTGIFSRIGAEATLPRITRAVHSRDTAAMTKPLLKGYLFGLGAAIMAAMAILVFGHDLVHLLYRGKLSVTRPDLAMMALALVAFPFAGTSMYVNGAFARFRTLLGPAFFLLACVIVAPIAASHLLGNDWSEAFLAMFTGAYVVMCLIHTVAIAGFVRSVGRKTI